MVDTGDHAMCVNIWNKVRGPPGPWSVDRAASPVVASSVADVACQASGSSQAASLPSTRIHPKFQIRLGLGRTSKVPMGHGPHGPAWPAWAHGLLRYVLLNYFLHCCCQASRASYHTLARIRHRPTAGLRGARPWPSQPRQALPTSILGPARPTARIRIR